MPRHKNIEPSYLLHKATGRGRLRWAGKDYYFPGDYGSAESRAAYHELVAKICDGQPIDPIAPTDDPEDPGPSVAELWLAFLDHAERYYVKNGKPTAEVDCFKSAMKPVVELYGLLPIKEFGQKQLKAARNVMVSRGWTRGFTNKSVGRVRAVFRWGSENELVDVVVIQRLETVAALRAGKTIAKDNPEREAVPEASIAAVKAIVSPLVADLMTLQLACGARPGELVMLTTGMIDRSGKVWTAKLADHKTVGHGKSRKLYFGPRAQAVLLKYFKADPSAKLFPITRKHYSDCIANAAEKLDLPRFTAHWLRHNTTTAVRDGFGIEAAQAVAGHSQPSMTAKYSTKMDKLAADVASKIG